MTRKPDKYQAMPSSDKVMEKLTEMRGWGESIGVNALYVQTLAQYVTPHGSLITLRSDLFTQHIIRSAP